MAGSLAILYGLHVLPPRELILGPTDTVISHGLSDFAVNSRPLRIGNAGVCADRISTDRICGTSGTISSLFFGEAIVVLSREKTALFDYL